MEHIWEERFENRQKMTFRAAFEQVFLEKKIKCRESALLTSIKGC